MKRCKIIYSMIFLSIFGWNTSGLCASEWLPLKNGRIHEPVNIKVLNNTWLEKEIIVEVPGIELETVNTKAGEFTRLTLDDEAFSGKIGDPRIPVLGKIIEIPFGTDVKFEINKGPERIISLRD